MLAKAYFVRSLFLCAVAVLLISGCAATGPSYTSLESTIPQLQTDQARLYFLRRGGFTNAALTARVHLNGTKVVNLNMDGFAYVDRPAGAVLIMIDAPLNPGEAKQTINVENGKTYYFFVENDYTNINEQFIAYMGAGVLGVIAHGGGRFAFYRISEEMALEQLKTKKLSGTSPP